MVIDSAAAQNRKALERIAEQLQQPHIARTIDAAGTDNRHLDSKTCRRLPRASLSVDFRNLINVARLERRVFVRRGVLDVAVNADRAAMHHAGHAGTSGAL